MKPKSKNPRANRALKEREPKTIEDAKSALFIKGHKTSQVVMDVMNDLVRMLFLLECLLWPLLNRSSLPFSVLIIFAWLRTEPAMRLLCAFG